MLDALVNQRIPYPMKIQPHYLDIQSLNQAAINYTYEVSKISAAALPLVSDVYQLLESGSAMGFGCGPILVSKNEISSHQLDKFSIAIPEKTMNFLF